MMGSISIGALASGKPSQARSLAARSAILPNGLLVQMERIPSASTDDLALNMLDIDGQSYLADVIDASSPQLAANPAPGRVSGKGTIVSALTQPLDVGALYLVSYDILADGGTTGLFFSNGGSPFPFSTSAAFTPGRHKILVVAQNTNANAILRVNGDLTFGFISCRKAQWHVNLPQGTAYPELATQVEPGRLQGGDVVVSALRASLEIGASYTLRYEILANAGTKVLQTAPDKGSPFPLTLLPCEPGHHAVTLIAQSGETAAVARMTGDLTFRSFSCRKAGGAAGRQIQMDVASGGARSRSAIYTPDPGALYVAPWGNDSHGSGAFASPLSSPAAACAVARPGDTVYLRPGTYAPFEIAVSGTAEQPITVTTLPGEERKAVIEGDLMQHVAHKGPGVPASSDNFASRDGVRIDSRDYIHVRNLTIRNVWRSGIFVVGTQGEQHGHHIFAGNLISYTGSSGINITGMRSDAILPLAETSDGPMRTDDVIIEHNDVSHTNVVTDYNNTPSNSLGEPGGVAEAISVSTGASNIITRFNDVHDTRQYGIDYKAGVKGGAIHDNRVWNVQRYGIYLDTGRRFVEDVAVYNNQVWACRLGIVLSREAGSDTVEYDTFTAIAGTEDFVQTLANIDIYNNLVWNTGVAGIFCQRHPKKDGPHGKISNIRIRFNTVYNANRDVTGRDLNLSGWSDSDFEAAGIVSGVDFIGNIVWNDTDDVRSIDTFAGKPGFAVEGNLIGIDPSFAAPKAEPPDLSLTPGSAARSVAITTVSVSAFPTDIGGAARGPMQAAGAYSALS